MGDREVDFDVVKAFILDPEPDTVRCLKLEIFLARYLLAVCHMYGQMEAFRALFGCMIQAVEAGRIDSVREIMPQLEMLIKRGE